MKTDPPPFWVVENLCCFWFRLSWWFSVLSDGKQIPPMVSYHGSLCQAVVCWETKGYGRYSRCRKDGLIWRHCTFANDVLPNILCGKGICWWSQLEPCWLGQGRRHQVCEQCQRRFDCNDKTLGPFRLYPVCTSDPYPFAISTHCIFFLDGLC